MQLELPCRGQRNLVRLEFRMAIINRQIIKELKKIKSRSRIYSMIGKIRKSSGYKYTKEEAAYLLAGQLGIDITKFLTKDELERIRTLRPQAPIKITMQEGKKLISKILKIGKFTLKDPLLPNRIINEAKKMAEDVYPIFYVFENSIRNLILTVMSKKYGNDWWESKTPSAIKKNVEGRLKKENKNRWHSSRRGVHKIFYTDFGDLQSIIIANWPDFKDLFPRQDWITSKFSDLELSRNIIAHNNPLQEDDIKRVESYFKDWIKQSKFIKSKL